MNKFVILFLLLGAANARATYGYEYWIPVMARDYLQLVDRNSPAQGPQKCESMYAPMIQDGILDVRYALGYFDDSTGVERIENGVNYGLSPSLDIDVYNGLRQQFTSACTGNLNLCGFDEMGDPKWGKTTYQKFVRIHGQKVLVRITMTQASASPSFEDNKGALLDRQSFLTRQSEDNFFVGLKSADVVFYNGHSRDGGGPDFNPPILNKHLKPDYSGYYQVKRPGIKRTFAALKENPYPGFVVGLFSCYSTRHFFKDFLKINPKQKLVLSADTIDYFDTMKASVGYLEGLMRGTCGQELADTAKQGDKIRGGFQGTHFN